MIENNQLMVFSSWCVLQVNEEAIVGYAPSWILKSSLELVKFLVIVLEYPLHDCFHLGLQHQYFSTVVLSL